MDKEMENQITEIVNQVVRKKRVAWKRATILAFLSGTMFGIAVTFFTLIIAKVIC
jgi:hypothetical protein